MALAFPDASVVRPSCPNHPGSTVRLDGFVRCPWSDAHRRPRYRCVTQPKTRGHVLSLPVPVRQPSELHPDSGRACPTCEHVYERHEGVKTGAGFVFGHGEIAELFLRIGEGMSLRDASAELRRSVFRVNHRVKSSLKSIGPGGTSRQANLAVNYLDAFAPAILDALHPKCWPAVIVIDSTTLLTRGYRKAESDSDAAETGDDQKRAGNLKAGTIMAAMEATARVAKPCLIEVQGGKDVMSWKAFFATLQGAPDWVMADLDPAIARAVRETWPKAILYHSRHHLAELMRERAIADGIPERVSLEEPIGLARLIPWSPTRSTVKRWGEHPLLVAITEAQRGPEQWAQLKALIELHIEPDKLALRSWIATNEILIERQWRIAQAHHGIPRSTGALEGKIGEWLAPIRRRAGRWQNARRLNLVLGLITLRGREEAHEARYTSIIRERFAARGNRSHRPSENRLPEEEYHGKRRQMSWWRTWHDRDEASLPHLVFESGRRARRRAQDEHAQWVRERLTERYEAENDLRKQLGISAPPTGRPKRPNQRPTGSVKGRFVSAFEDLMIEWDWDLNGDLDPQTVRAGGKERVAWRCLLNPEHVWETRVADRTYRASFCPYHMGNRVHPSESLAAYYPWLAREWHPTKNALRPDQVTRASGREAIWRCKQGHEWSAIVHSRTLSQSDCPECYKLEAAARTNAGRKRVQKAKDAHAAERLAKATPLEELAGD